MPRRNGPRGDDVERNCAMADVYVMSSVSETFGISPPEAMALDVPVIVSRQSGVAEILTSQGRDEVRAMRWEARGLKVRDIYREVVA